MQLSPRRSSTPSVGRLHRGQLAEGYCVRDFIQKNYTPYEGDETFLAPATEKTKHLWKYLDDNYLAVERKQRVYDVDTHTPADVDAFPAATSTPRKSITWSLASRPTFPASAR